ncbi:MAG TPA: hypothetical protein VK256_09915, partial [Candidatus Eisenbacteria bacterium]|nr:hypothetical protein [Candidatus Eisenbacteria bacterium]
PNCPDSAMLAGPGFFMGVALRGDAVGSRRFDRRVSKLVFFRRLRNSAIVAHIVLVRARNIGGTFADVGRALRGHFLDVMETRFIALGCFVVRTEDGSPELGSNQRATD